MKSVNLLGLAMVSLTRALTTGDPFYTNGIIRAEVSQHAKNLSTKPDWENPIFLDSYTNGLLPNKILTTFKSPNFIGDTPPGVTNFMVTQVLLNGERPNGTVYPLWMRDAIKKFDGKNKRITVDDVCTKDKNGKPCADGYKKVTVKKDKIDCAINTTVEEAVTTTTKTTSTGEAQTGGVLKSSS